MLTGPPPGLEQRLTERACPRNTFWVTEISKNKPWRTCGAISPIWDALVVGALCVLGAVSIPILTLPHFCPRSAVLCPPELLQRWQARESPAGPVHRQIQWRGSSHTELHGALTWKVRVAIFELSRPFPTALVALMLTGLASVHLLGLCPGPRTVHRMKESPSPACQFPVQHQLSSTPPPRM